ncbi:unnamed protein product, partial [Mesorhabditis belari]|uniref:Uncharacterized protein n=1 Tax=Mesorhabditis belari TaxID=2138241 RepID=A0AAF3J7S1_9BILA
MDSKLSSSFTSRLRNLRINVTGIKPKSPTVTVVAVGGKHFTNSQIMSIPAEKIEHDTKEGREIFYYQVCQLLRKKCNSA